VVDYGLVLHIPSLEHTSRYRWEDSRLRASTVVVYSRLTNKMGSWMPGRTVALRSRPYRFILTLTRPLFMAHMQLLQNAMSLMVS